APKLGSAPATSLLALGQYVEPREWFQVARDFGPLSGRWTQDADLCPAFGRFSSHQTRRTASASDRRWARAGSLASDERAARKAIGNTRRTATDPSPAAKQQARTVAGGRPGCSEDHRRRPAGEPASHQALQCHGIEPKAPSGHETPRSAPWHRSARAPEAHRSAVHGVPATTHGPHAHAGAGRRRTRRDWAFGDRPRRARHGRSAATALTSPASMASA